MANSVTSFETSLATKILKELDDTTIGHLTNVSNIIRDEMEKYKTERIKQLEQALIDSECHCEELQMQLEELKMNKENDESEERVHTKMFNEIKEILDNVDMK